jgi:hypothetical protein
MIASLMMKRWAAKLRLGKKLAMNKVLLSIGSSHPSMLATSSNASTQLYQNHLEKVLGNVQPDLRTGDGDQTTQTATVTRHTQVDEREKETTMNVNAHNKETANALSRWWSPGQWLHIVYGVWVDQVWYWQNVRPRFSNRRQRVSICIQGLLGTALASLVLSAVLGGVSAAAGISVNWTGLFRAVGIALGAASGGALLMTVNSVATTASHGMVLGMVMGLAGGSVIPMTILVENGCIPSGLPSRVFTGLVLGLVLGVGVSVFMGVVMGDRLGVALGIVLVMGMVVVSAIMGIAIEGIAAGITIGLGLHLGGRWATRQVPDVETRKRLANPDAHRSES